MSDDLTQEQIDRITAEIRAGRKISAIKMYREATGKGLKEAKDFIDAIEGRLPKENFQQVDAGADGRRGCFGVLLIAIGLLTVAAWLSGLA